MVIYIFNHSFTSVMKSHLLPSCVRMNRAHHLHRRLCWVALKARWALSHCLKGEVKLHLRYWSLVLWQFLHDYVIMFLKSRTLLYLAEMDILWLKKRNLRWTPCLLFKKWKSGTVDAAQPTWLLSLDFAVMGLRLQSFRLYSLFHSVHD